MVAEFQGVFRVEKAVTSEQGHFCLILLVETHHGVIPDSRVGKFYSILFYFFNLFFLEKFQNMSIGGQGQGKAWAAFRLTGLPHKGSRLNCGGPLPPPGPPPSLPCPPAPPPCDPSEGGTHCARPHHARKEDDRDAPAPGPTRGTGVPPLPSRPHPHHSCSPEAPPQWEPRGSLRTGNDITAGP